jgi:hypothetical protein
LAALGLGACSDDASNGPSPGVATIGFAPKAVNLPYINLTRARARLDRLQLIGNVPPPPPPGYPPPPGDHPPPDGSWQPPPPSFVDLDALSAAPSSTMIADLPQGLYSRVRFILGRISLEGTARGTVFRVSLEPFGVVVDVRASVPQELGLDQDASFEVAVDPNFWFPPYMFEGATLDNRGEIVCDDVSNGQIAQLLIPAMASSFWLP